MCTRHPGHFIQDNAHLSEGNCLHFLKPTYWIQFISLKIFLQTISIVSKYFPQDSHQFIVIKGKNNPFQQRKPGRPPTWTKWPQSKQLRIRYTTTMCPLLRAPRRTEQPCGSPAPNASPEPASKSQGVRLTTEQSQCGGDQGDEVTPTHAGTLGWTGRWSWDEVYGWGVVAAIAALSSGEQLVLWGAGRGARGALAGTAAVAKLFHKKY